MGCLFFWALRIISPSDGNNDQEAVFTSLLSMHHSIISLPISGLSNQLGIMQPSRTLTSAPRVIRMDEGRGSKHNLEFRMPSARSWEGLLNFHPFVSFLCICQKIKLFLSQTFAENIRWELITLGDVRNSSGLSRALVRNSCWDYVITGIVIRDDDTMLLTYLVISGSVPVWLCLCLCQVIMS